jgi:hypothetical protein
MVWYGVNVSHSRVQATAIHNQQLREQQKQIDVIETEMLIEIEKKEINRKQRQLEADVKKTARATLQRVCARLLTAPMHARFSHFASCTPRGCPPLQS